MNTHDTPTQMSFNEVMALVREKSKWLTTQNKIDLARKHGYKMSALRAQLSGTVKKPSYDLLSDALDMIRVNEKKLLTRLQ